MKNMNDAVYNALSREIPKTTHDIGVETGVSLKTIRKKMKYFVQQKEACIVGTIRTSGLPAPQFILGDGVDFVIKPKEQHRVFRHPLDIALYGEYQKAA